MFLPRRVVIFKRLSSTAAQFKVGIVRQVNLHPDADSLYVSQIDAGEEAPRTVVSGLRGVIAADRFENSRVVLVTNLKPSKLRGVKSEAMVLAASNPDRSLIELVRPPSGSEPGEPLRFANMDYDESSKAVSGAKIKSSVWKDLQGLLKTNEACEVIYGSDNHRLVTPRGEPCIVDTIANGTVS
ncbi:hypothetical protein TRVA0_004S02520 [Trichomonascus vanleenenianus]|uniref:uncharacterized protein n=1 Tax=Trichomonascus vanleenenianus TaxID=2268995 RepID=UPI003EC9BC90